MSNNKTTKFKPRLRIDGPGTPSNGERADRAYGAVLAWVGTDRFDELCGEEIQDLLTDLRHLCHREDIDIEGLIASSKQHWIEESGQGVAFADAGERCQQCGAPKAW